MVNNKNISIIVAAAGSSLRFGNNISKQFLLLEDKPLLLYSLEKFALLQNVLEIVIVTNDINETNRFLKKTGFVDIKIKTVLGGKLRQDSVYNGFCAIDPESHLVIIHDVARPLFRLEDVKRCIEQAIKSGAAILAVPVVDTIKRSKLDSGELLVKDTLNREELYLVQTPQVFRYELLADVYKSRNTLQRVSTDEASMVEHLGRNVILIIGDRKNIKITYPEDLEIASAFLKEERKEVCLK